MDPSYPVEVGYPALVSHAYYYSQELAYSFELEQHDPFPPDPSLPVSVTFLPASVLILSLELA